MSDLILDAGALIAAERGDREYVALVEAARLGGLGVRTHAFVVGQVWRDGARQARLARFLRSVEVDPVDEAFGRRCGELLGRCATEDVVDAGVALLARDGDRVVTSDSGDIKVLVEACGTAVRLVPL